MIESLASAFENALGLHLEADNLSVAQMSLRAVVVFLAAAMMIRIANKRFMGSITAFDVMLGIMFGSIVGRAITGNAPFFPTLAAGLVLVLCHRIIAAVAFRSHRFGNLFKGTHQLLVENGTIRWDAMRRTHITEHDLHEAMRNHGEAPDIRRIKEAHLERNGGISIQTE
jgi:uncharacterized membrane protein YcaP (DUF421 family)